ncbi:uncharacterized protein LOC144755269 isoform X2 [Lissotriton helveticus]
MFQQTLVKAPVRFSDVVACFSEEEWKLLHEWQNELYNNVMKEIHQVLNSLGPLIANSVFSLKVKEEEDVCPLKNRSTRRKSTVTVPTSDIHSNSDVSLGLNHDKTQYQLGPVDSGRRESNNCLNTDDIHSNSDVSIGLNHDKTQYLLEPVGSGRRENNNCLITDDIHSNSDVSIGLNHDKTQYLLGPVGSGRRESNNCLITGPIDSNPDVLFGINQENKQESKQYLHEPPHSDPRESSNCLTTEHESSEPIVSIVIKEERDTEYIGQDETMEHISDPRDAGSVNINKSFGQSVKCDDKSAPCKSSTGKVKAKLIYNLVEKSHYTRQIWSGNYQDPSRGKSKRRHGQSGFYHPAPSISYHRTPNLQRTGPFNECQSVMANLNIMAQDANTLQYWRIDAGNEKPFLPYESPIEHQRPPTENVRDAYFEQEKNISAVSKPLELERTHNQERPYSCTVCGKSFNNKQIYLRHQKIHTGERPYKCTVCGNSFRLKEFLNQHLSIHTGERPYGCAVCGKSFSRKGTLARHQTIHKK